MNQPFAIPDNLREDVLSLLYEARNLTEQYWTDTAYVWHEDFGKLEDDDFLSDLVTLLDEGNLNEENFTVCALGAYHMACSRLQGSYHEDAKWYARLALDEVSFLLYPFYKPDEIEPFELMDGYESNFGSFSFLEQLVSDEHDQNEENAEYDEESDPSDRFITYSRNNSYFGIEAVNQLQGKDATLAAYTETISRLEKGEFAPQA